MRALPHPDDYVAFCVQQGFRGSYREISVFVVGVSESDSQRLDELGSAGEIRGLPRRTMLHLEMVGHLG